MGYGHGDGSHPEESREGNCDFVHGHCYVIPPQEDAQALTVQELTLEISSAVVARDVAALADYLGMPSVTLNAAHSAIQVRGCDGETIAGHLPVNPTLLLAIELATVQPDSNG